MEYRINRRTGERISILGLGSSSLASSGEGEGIETLQLALENGINYYDLATSGSVNFSIFGNGGHGMSLCTPLTCYVHEDYPANMAEWFPLCVNWLKSLYHF